MPFYVVTTKGEEAKRLIKAPSSASAVKHCAADMFETQLISTIEEAAPHFEAGVKLEKTDTE